MQLITDPQLQLQQLQGLHEKYKNTDGGQQALYKLALLKIKIWRDQDEQDVELRKQKLSQARDCLTNFIKLYPKSIFAPQAQKNLQDLPATE